MSAIPDHITAAEMADVRAPWRDLAACRGRSALMDPPPGKAGLLREQKALRLCWACPALDECREWVLGLTELGDPGGVCGALTADQRRRWRRRAGWRARTGQTAPPDGDGATLRCTRCDERKPLDDFAPDPRNVNRHCRRSHCRTCVAEWRREYRARKRRGRA